MNLLRTPLQLLLWRDAINGGFSKRDTHALTKSL
jgi:hypothetical protein